MYNREDFNIETRIVTEDFVALDFETVNIKAEGFFGADINMRVPCQVGLVVVENGIINEEKSLNLNIKPIGIEECYSINEFSLKWIANHTHIVEPEMKESLNPKEIWANAPTFDKVWSKLVTTIGNKPIVAHMASVERSAIVNACNHYGLSIPETLTFVCSKLTSELIDRNEYGHAEQDKGLRTLTKCCSRYGIDFSEEEHHDAYSDAKATATLMLKMRNGIRPISLNDMEKIELPSVNGDAFAGKRIVMTGNFYIYQESNGIRYRRYLSNEERDTLLKDWLISLGAKFTKAPSINSRLDILFVGEEPGWAKIKKVKELQQSGCMIEILDQTSLNDLINNDSINFEEVKDNPFKGKRISIVGRFLYDIKILRERFRRLGATIDSKITKNTHYILLGHDIENTKQEEVDDVIIRRGWAVHKLTEEDLENILKGNYENLNSDNKLRKNLSLHFEYHIMPNLLEFNDDLNIIYEENVFVPSNIKGRKDLMAQILGNLGAYANDEITNSSESDKTKPIVMLTSETVNKLKNKEKDNITEYIESIYNNSNAISLDYKFVIEEELLEWISKRSDTFQDNNTSTLLSMYNDSKIYQEI